MSLLSDNMNLARQAIRYVDKLGITSINVPVRPGRGVVPDGAGSHSAVESSAPRD
jgi:hypothetical protein